MTRKHDCYLELQKLDPCTGDPNQEFPMPAYMCKYCGNMDELIGATLTKGTPMRDAAQKKKKVEV